MQCAPVFGSILVKLTLNLSLYVCALSWGTCIVAAASLPLTGLRIFPSNPEPDFTHYLSVSEAIRKEHHK